MTEPHRPRVKYVIGPDGSPLTIADLPAPGTRRWVIRRKAEVVAAVRLDYDLPFRWVETGRGGTGTDAQTRHGVGPRPRARRGDDP